MIISDTINYDTTGAIITWTGATSANGTWSSGTFFTGQLDIAELNLGQFIRNRNGTPYSMYDSGLLLMYSFDTGTELNTLPEYIINGGTGNQSDFVDTDNNGLANNWLLVNNGTPTIINSISSGNGF